MLLRIIALLVGLYVGEYLSYSHLHMARVRRSVCNNVVQSADGKIQ